MPPQMVFTREITSLRSPYKLSYLPGWMNWYFIYHHHCCYSIITIIIVIAAATIVDLDNRKEEVFDLTTHSTHFIYGYMASDIW